jgi:hypothetical protein
LLGFFTGSFMLLSVPNTAEFVHYLAKRILIEEMHNLFQVSNQSRLVFLNRKVTEIDPFWIGLSNGGESEGFTYSN